MTKLRRGRRDRRGDHGFTMVELLVAMSLIMVIVAVSMSTVVLSSDVVKTSRQVQSINEEARHAINRMARDLRQADSLVTAVNPDRPGFAANGLVAIRFLADFDGDGCYGGVGASCLGYNASNPEDVTYCYEPSTDQLYVIDNGATPTPTPISAASTSCAGGQPLLAGNVASFKISYGSSQYLYDSNADGATSWRELDAAGLPIGNTNGALDDELIGVNSLVLDMTMTVDGHSQVYRTQVDLRNRAE